MTKSTQLQIARHHFGHTKFTEEDIPALTEGQVLLKVDRFAFTANNITYALLGDRFDYWKFFPADEGHGIIPVWGFAEVIASEQEEIAIGSRYYGYYPMSSHLLVEPTHISEQGFVDGKAHRKALPAVYNFYASSPTTKNAAEEAVQALYRPLFTTSFLIDVFFASCSFFEASQIILTSASSKTAYGLAFLLANRKKTEGKQLSIVGLTSQRNKDFVEQLGFYDQVFSYDDFTGLKHEPSAIIDFSGNHQLQYTLQHYLGNKLCYNSLVGMVDWNHLKGTEGLPRVGDVFFAPTHYSQRLEEWGAEVLRERIDKAWAAFNQNLTSWLEISEQSGQAAIMQVYGETLLGKAEPKKGNILRF